MASYCFDASVLVIYVSGVSSDTRLDSIMKEIESKKSEGYLSLVNLAEFHRAVSKIYSSGKADVLAAWLQESKMKLVPPSIEISVLASLKKQKYASKKNPFAWGDAFCLATAIDRKTDLLLTADKDFKKVKEVPVLFF